MTGKKIIAGLTEAVAVAKGEQPATAILHNGHRYVLEVTWQPISTAPRDGTDVLVWLGAKDQEIDRRSEVAFWREGSWIVMESWITVEPTHWRPLPDPPPSHGLDDRSFDPRLAATQRK